MIQHTLPSGITQEYLVETIDHISNQLKSFAFGYYTPEDIKSECYIFALQALPKYDHNRPLVNFLYVHIRNRLTNLRRDKLFRPEKKMLEIKDSENESDQKLFQGYVARNVAKQSLINPIDIYNHANSITGSDPCQDESDRNEIIGILDGLVPPQFRREWLRLRLGLNVSSQRARYLFQHLRKYKNLMEDSV